MRVDVVLGAATAFTVAALGLAFIHPFGNPRLTPAPARSDLLRGASMSEGARNVLIQKCADCHSDTTHWPVYTHVAPASWLVEKDVIEGRKHLNLSHWMELSEDQRQVLSAEIVSQAKKGAMPPFQYLLIHWNAGLTPQDTASLLPLSSGAEGTGEVKAADINRGRALFEKRCTGCHSIDSNREGPKLRGVYGRKAGSLPDFSYSSELKNSGVTWADANFERWLRDSEEMMPQSAMGFVVPKLQDRLDLVAFLKQQK